GGRQALADLWQMPMPGSPVGLETLAYFTVEHANLALPASTAGAGLGIGYQPCRIDQTVFQQRQESQLYSCRITPWIRNQLSVTDGLAGHFRQTVHRFFGPVGTLVGHAIPVCPGIKILQAEIRRQIDDANT